ncbi:RICIN domain-containing protein [Streptomyces tsukubensis]|uniref:RICIN domain-containing protein n=1 Tax=Streptomyces tsukubensis TaxID=83656 RepID=UPI00344F75DE
MHKQLATLAFATTLALTTSATPTQATSDLRSQASYTYMISAHHSGKCLDIENASRDQGARLIQKTCDASSPSQKFIVEDGFSQTVRLNSSRLRTFAGLCLTRDHGDIDRGTSALTQQDCAPRDLQDRAHLVVPQQSWGKVTIKTLNYNLNYNRFETSGLCWAVWGGSSEDGATVGSYRCYDALNLLFKFKEMR